MFREHKGMIALQDVEIIHYLGGSLFIRVHQKPTHMDQYLQFSPNHPLTHKWSVDSFEPTQKSCLLLLHWRDEAGGVITREENAWSEWLSRIVNLSRVLTFYNRNTEKKDPRAHTTIPYVQGFSDAAARILPDLDVRVHMKPWCTLGSILLHSTDQVSDAN